MNKRIEEMEADIKSIVEARGGEVYPFEMAAILCELKGYRKMGEGEWEKRVWIFFDSEKVGYRCSECNTTWDTPTPFCPKCGAKMRRKEDEGK